MGIWILRPMLVASCYYSSSNGLQPNSNGLHPNSFLLLRKGTIGLTIHLKFILHLWNPPMDQLPPCHLPACRPPGGFPPTSFRDQPRTNDERPRPWHLSATPQSRTMGSWNPVAWDGLAVDRIHRPISRGAFHASLCFNPPKAWLGFRSACLFTLDFLTDDTFFRFQVHFGGRSFSRP